MRKGSAFYVQSYVVPEHERFESLNVRDNKKECNSTPFCYGAPGRILNLSFAPALWIREVNATQSYVALMRERFESLSMNDKKT